jgi:hypothetical protein
VGPAFKGQLNWLLISRICRAQWEKSMASCCLGIVMQHQLEFKNQVGTRHGMLMKSGRLSCYGWQDAVTQSCV